jgi:hypothetical protein
MPRIQKSSMPVTVPNANAQQTTAPRKPAASTSQASVKQGWTAGVGSATAKPKYPEVATTAKNFVDAYAAGNKAMTQVEMVNSSINCNKAADAMLTLLATELSSQYADRGQDAKGAKVQKDLATFFNKVGQPKAYRLDPERGTMASLEDNGARMEKVLAQLQKLSAELGKVNAEPAGEYQQAYNRSAGGDFVKAQADFALKFQKRYSESGADDAVIKKAQTFFKALPKNVDSQVQSRGGSLEPLERAGGAARLINEFAAKL